MPISRFSRPDETAAADREARLEIASAQETFIALTTLVQSPGWAIVQQWIDAYINTAHIDMEQPIEREAHLQRGGGCKALRGLRDFLTTSIEEARSIVEPNEEEEDDVTP